MNYFKRLFLVLILSITVIQPINNNLKAAVPCKEYENDIQCTDSIQYIPEDTMNKINQIPAQDSVNNKYYDYQKLKEIEDSLKVIDPRNAIEPEIGSFVHGRVFLGVKIYSNILKGDQENVTIRKIGRNKNRCINNAFKSAKIITRCAYKQDDVFVG